MSITSENRQDTESLCIICSNKIAQFSSKANENSINSQGLCQYCLQNSQNDKRSLQSYKSNYQKFSGNAFSVSSQNMYIKSDSGKSDCMYQINSLSNQSSLKTSQGISAFPIQDRSNNVNIQSKATTPLSSKEQSATDSQNSSKKYLNSFKVIKPSFMHQEKKTPATDMPKKQTQKQKIGEGISKKKPSTQMPKKETHEQKITEDDSEIY